MGAKKADLGARDPEAAVTSINCHSKFIHAIHESNNRGGKKTRLAWMQFFAGDYIAQTRHLSLEQRGAIMDLLALSWCVGPLPADPHRLAPAIGVTVTEFRRVWPGIASSWTPIDGGLMVNPDLEMRRTASLKTYEKRAQSGRNSAVKRTQRKGISPKIPFGNGDE
jgi:uncharacterized protein YdaU (DUF1376 family)